MSHQITCVTKPDRDSHHEAIQRVGGVESGGAKFNISREACYDQIKNGQAYHVVVGRNDVTVIAYQINGVGKYIRTTPDATKKDNLLSLPPCS